MISQEDLIAKQIESNVGANVSLESKIIAECILALAKQVARLNDTIESGHLEVIISGDVHTEQGI